MACLTESPVQFWLSILLPAAHAKDCHYMAVARDVIRWWPLSASDSSHNTIDLNSAYLCPCHNFYLPSPCIPGSKRNQEESGDGGKVASVEEWIGNAQEPCANTEIYQKEKPKKNVHRFWSLDQSFLRPGPLPRHHSCWFVLKVSLPLGSSGEILCNWAFGIPFEQRQ